MEKSSRVRNTQTEMKSFGYRQTPNDASARMFRSRPIFWRALVDACYSPVNKITKSSGRKRAIVKDIPRLVDETMKLNPEKIIIVKKSIFDPLRKRVRGVFPHPSRRHVGWLG
jgi:hypothetical protein